MKSEPGTYSIDDLERDGSEPWDGVRNYQARNFMRDMAEGDLAIFYHSSAQPTGAVGVCRICHLAYPDPTQFNKKSPYYDAKSNKEEEPVLRRQVQQRGPTLVPGRRRVCREVRGDRLVASLERRRRPRGHDRHAKGLPLIRPAGQQGALQAGVENGRGEDARTVRAGARRDTTRGCDERRALQCGRMDLVGGPTQGSPRSLAPNRRWLHACRLSLGYVATSPHRAAPSPSVRRHLRRRTARDGQHSEWVGASA